MGCLIYVYGLISTNEASRQALLSIKGFDGISDIYTIPLGKITAIVCNLNPEEYSEEKIKDKTNNDMEWLQEKAFHHHETVIQLSQIYTIIPMKFCTLYMNQVNLEAAVHSNEDQLTETLHFIHGKEEWNVKIYSDDQSLRKQVSDNHPAIEAKRAEISALSKGKQFFEKKKLDRLIDSELEEEKNKISENIHRSLKEYSLEGHVKNTWSNQVTGRKDDMTWNGVYLIPQSNVEEFLQQIQQYERDMKEAGWRFEATGPWPAYHFSSMTK